LRANEREEEESSNFPTELGPIAVESDDKEQIFPSAKPSLKTDYDETLYVLQENALFLSRAALIGSLTGAAVVVLKSSIQATSAFFYEYLADILPKPAFYWPLILYPVLGSSLVALLTYFRSSSLKIGIDLIAKSIDADPTSPSSSSTSAFTPLDLLFRASASVATLGSGCSLGPEGPAVEIGAGLSRILSSASSPVRERHHLFLAGTAAGVSAGFNAPIAGVFFAIECGNRYLSKNTIKLDEESPDGPRADIAAIVLAATLAAVVSGLGLHEGNALTIQGNSFAMTSPLFELPLYLGLGIVAGLVSVVFSRALESSKALFEDEASLFSTIPVNFRPLLGGLLCGIAAIYYPQTLFVGYATLDQLLAGKIQLALPFLAQLLVLKIGLSSFSLGSGLVGGVFAPSLFFGAIAGTGYHDLIAPLVTSAHNALQTMSSSHNTLAEYLLPFVNMAGAPAYATVGAAATLGSLFRAPLTATIL